MSPSKMAWPNRNTNQSRSFAIFWDIENCPVPGDVQPEDVAGNIMNALQPHHITEGTVTLFSAYGDFNNFPRRVRSGCQRTGVKLVDVPNGRKDAADKAILIDMLLFAMDNHPPSTIMLISGDVDFSPALHILNQRGYTVILMIRSGVFTSPALKNAAKFVWDWPSLARGQGLVLPSNPLSTFPSSSPAKVSRYSVGYLSSCLSKTSLETKNSHNQDNVVCVPPGDLNSLKSQIVNLLKLAGGILPLALLSDEYSKIYGRPLFVTNLGAVKLIGLLKKMSDAVAIRGKGNKIILYLDRSSPPVPACPNATLRRVKHKVNRSKDEKRTATEDHDSQCLMELNLTRFKHELEEILVSYSCRIFLGWFEAMYQLRYKQKLDYHSLGVKNLEELLFKMTDVVELQGDPENSGKFIVPVCR